MQTAEVEDAEVIDSTSRQLKAAEQLPPGLMLLKMENESIMSVARAAPRDSASIVKQLAALIEAYPAAADEAIYSKPVGTVQQLTCGDCKIKYEVSKVEADTVCPNCESKKRDGGRPVKKYAEGLSIRAAESIRSIFGYTRLSVTCDILENGSARLSGTLVDYAAGNMTSDERVVSPYYKSRSGAMVKTPEDRFLGVVVKAEKAKLRRDVILDSVPGIIKAMFRDMCEQKLLMLVSPELIEQKIIPAFEEFGITREHLDKIVGRPFSLGWREEDRLALRKILSALKNQETTKAELLEGLETVPGTSAPSGNGGVKTGDLTSPQSGQQTATQTQSTATTEKSASGKETAETKVTEPATGDAGTKPVVDQKTRWAGFAAEFEKCKTRTEVTDTKHRLKAQGADKDDEFEIDRLADVTRDRIGKEAKGK
jgi:hypothetical protein